jgi:hypothetical protein
MIPMIRVTVEWTDGTIAFADYPTQAEANRIVTFLCGNDWCDAAVWVSVRPVQVEDTSF